MIRIAVAEDDLSWAHQLQAYVDQYARESGKSFEVSLFADGEDLLEQYHGQFDLVFLDVQMRFLDGMATGSSTTPPRRSTSAPGPSRTRRRSWRATTSSAATRAIS